MSTATCSVCKKGLDYVKRRASTWECSHLECPIRRREPVLPTDALVSQGYRGGQRPVTDKHHTETGTSGCYRVDTKTREYLE